MAFFNSRKRQETTTVVLEEAVPAAPAPVPEPALALPAQSSPAPLGAGLRLVSAPAPAPESALRLAPAPEIEEDRAEDLRGLPLGTILYRQGLLQQDVLEGALVSGMESGERLGEILIRQGLISQDDIARALAAQNGLSFLTEAELALDREIAALLPVATARELGAVPVRTEGDAVVAVTAEPSTAQKDALEARLHWPVIQAVVSKGVFDALLHDVEHPQVVAVAPAAEVAAPVEPAVDAPEQYHESEEEVMEQVWSGGNVEEAAPEEGTEQVWTGGNAEEAAPEAWVAEPAAHEAWSAPVEEVAAEPVYEPVHEQAHEPVYEQAHEHAHEPVHEHAHEPVHEHAHEPVHEPVVEHVEPPAYEPVYEPELAFEQPAPQEWSHEPAEMAAAQVAPVIEDEVVRELSAQHDASVGRIGDLLNRIEEGATTYGDLRARLGGLTESLRVSEETVANRDRRLAELTGAYEAGERRIEELVAQVHDREEELRSVGARVEDLSGRLTSAEERIDDRERKLDELFRQVERRDTALSAFEAKLDSIAAHFAAEPQA